MARNQTIKILTLGHPQMKISVGWFLLNFSNLGKKEKTVAERIVINLGVAGSKSANSLVQKYGKISNPF
jgi:hypothetical protein